MVWSDLQIGIRRRCSLTLWCATHGVEIGEVLVHFRVAEDSVTLTHSPQHTFKGLHLHPLDETWHKAAARRHWIELKVHFQDDITTFSCANMNGSPQFGSKSLHARAPCHWVRLHSGEFFILGTKSLMLIMKRSTFHSYSHGSTHSWCHVCTPECNVCFHTLSCKIAATLKPCQ